MADTKRERLAKLEALATDRAGTPEGELAARLARQLLAKIDQATRRHLATDPISELAVPLGGEQRWRRKHESQPDQCLYRYSDCPVQATNIQ